MFTSFQMHQVFYLFKLFRFFGDRSTSHSIDVIRRVLLSPDDIFQSCSTSANTRGRHSSMETALVDAETENYRALPHSKPKKCADACFARQFTPSPPLSISPSPALSFSFPRPLIKTSSRKSREPTFTAWGGNLGMKFFRRTSRPTRVRYV